MEKLPQNLVVVMHSNLNSDYPELVSEYPPGLEIDMVDMTWSYKSQQFNASGQSATEIGCHDYMAKNCRGRVIGVYDRTNNEHLRAMIIHWNNLTSSTCAQK